MFFYSHCGRGFICLYGGRSKRCLKSSSLCGNLRNNFGPHKALRRTWHIWTQPHAPRWTYVASGFCVSWYVICLLVAVWIHYDVSYLILRQHTSSFHTRNLPFHLENLQYNTTATTQSQLTEILNLCEIRDGNVSFPSLRTVIQLPVVMP